MSVLVACQQKGIEYISKVFLKKIFTFGILCHIVPSFIDKFHSFAVFREKIIQQPAIRYIAIPLESIRYIDCD